MASTSPLESGNSSLSSIIEEYVASGDFKLPVFNHTANRVRTIAESENMQMDDVAKVIIQDQSLAIQVLKYANTSFYAGLSKVKTIKDAAVRLGSKQLVEIVFLISTSENYKSDDKQVKSYLQTLWKHSVACALGSRWLAAKLGHKRIVQEAFMSGLFHDIGKLLVLKALDDIAKDPSYAIELNGPLILEITDTMHCEKGELLMREWSLPEEYVEVVRGHHSQLAEDSTETLVIVRLVDKLCNKMGIGLSVDEDLSIMDTEEAQRLKVTEVTIAELEITIEEALGIA